MRTTLLSLTALLPLFAAAQCPFDVDLGPDLILCPNDGVVLDAGLAGGLYQWYQDGVLIPGATSQTYFVTSEDAGSQFTLEATLDGCTEMSPPVLVDSWVFLLPYVIHGGDEPYMTGFEGESYFCEGDTLLLDLGQPYTQNIQWTNDGVDIPGATTPTLVVTQTGGYSVSGAPEVCPDFILGLGLTIGAIFTPNAQPEIIDDGEQLCVYPTGNSTQWYLNDVPIGTTDCITPDAPGVYTAFVDYDEPCQIASEPHLITGIADVHDIAFGELNCNGDQLTVRFTNDVRGGSWRVIDATGRSVSSGSISGPGMLNVDLSDEVSGAYLFQVTLEDGSIAQAKRFALVR